MAARRSKKITQSLRSVRLPQNAAEWKLFLRKSIPRVVLGGIGFLLLLFLLVYIGVFGSIPGPKELEEIKNGNASEVISENGAVIGKFFIQNRTNINFNEISPHVIEALIATEDKRFFEHRGIDYRSMMRVIVKSILLGKESSGGGSTLSQQLAKNLFPRKKYWFFATPINKIREIIIAGRLESVYSKEELLNLYLNTVPFSDNVYGIQVASTRFFNKSAKDLKIEEAALLVGTLKANSAYHPVRKQEKSRQRRNVVLAQMKVNGYIDPGACDSLQALPVVLDYVPGFGSEGRTDYFLQEVRKRAEEALAEMVKPDKSHYNLELDGLKIYTTIDSRMQLYAEQAVEEHFKVLQKQFDDHWVGGKPLGDEKIVRTAMLQSPRYLQMKEAGASDEEIEKAFQTPIEMKVFTWNGIEERTMSPYDSLKYYMLLLNTGFMAMEPRTGKIRAWVGGIDYHYFQYDHVTSKRQIGSIVKPIVYANAILQGIDPCSYFHDSLITYPEYEGWTPENADKRYGGYYSMEGALAKSVNTIAAQVVLEGGVQPTAELAKRLGITEPFKAVPSIALGTMDASLLQMVTVFGTFANRGVKPEPYYLKRIENANGEVLVDFEKQRKPQQIRVLDTLTVDLVTQMMRSATRFGTASRLRTQFALTNDIAGKTGTTQSNVDGWFMGFIPDLVAGVWVGADNPLVRWRWTSLGQGANSALPVWGRWMHKMAGDPVLKKMTFKNFRELSPDEAEMMNCTYFFDDRIPEDTLSMQPYLDEISGEMVLPQFTRDDSLALEDRRKAKKEWIKRQMEKVYRRREEKDETLFDRIFKKKAHEEQKEP